MMKLIAGGKVHEVDIREYGDGFTLCDERGFVMYTYDTELEAKVAAAKRLRVRDQLSFGGI